MPAAHERFNEYRWQPPILSCLSFLHGPAPNVCLPEPAPAHSIFHRNHNEQKHEVTPTAAGLLRTQHSDGCPVCSQTALPADWVARNASLVEACHITSTDSCPVFFLHIPILFAPYVFTTHRAFAPGSPANLSSILCVLNQSHSPDVCYFALT